MSATITYKGSALATVNNETKTLKTSGKYMEDDVIITDVTDSSAILVNDTEDEHGGIIREIIGKVVKLQTKTITPTSSVQTVNPDEGYDGFSQVTVNASSGDFSWQTLYDGNVEIYSSNPNYFQISPYTTAFQAGQTYRVTWGQTQYLCTTIAVTGDSTYDGYVIGNLSIVGMGSDTGEPFIIYRSSATELTGGTISSAGTESLKIELQQSGSLPKLQSKTVTPTELQQIVQADSGYDGLSTVTVNAISSTYVGSGIIRRSSTDLTVSDATVTAPAGYYTEDVSKSVSSMTLPTAAASSATSGYTSKATIGRSTAAQYINIPPGYNSAGAYYVISAVANGSATAPASISGTAASVSTGNGTLTLTKTVSVTPSVTAGYVSSGTAGNSSVSLTASVTINPTPTASGATVTIPAGYYTEATSKAVTTMTLPTSAASSATSGYTKKATISRSTSTQYINIAPGYNSAGGYYEISAVANGSATGPSSLSGSSATVSTGTNTLTLTKTGVTTTPTVTAGYVSSATASTATVTLTASVTTKAAATITPTTTNQTIAAGTYLTGVQTIAGDADLVGSNILSTANIFGVQGTVDFIDVYIRSAAPTSSVGNDGDIYIQE